MIRTLALLVGGIALGVGATLLLVAHDDSPLELDDSPLALFSSDALTPPPASAPPPEVSRDFYRRLADADARELARMIRETAAAPASTDRDLALAVLLKHHAELDVVGAVRLAREVGVRGAALGTVYSAWARRAPTQVLAALSTIGSPDDAAEVALALIVALGNDARAVERVAAVLAERADEPLPGVGTAPVGPIVAPPVIAATRSSLGLLAARWAELAPKHALAVSRELGDERFRSVFEAAALRAVARVAPNEAFAELANRDADAAQLGALGGAVVELARADPERVLSMASGLPLDVRRLAESAAMQQLAERDPAAALRHLERMPVGMERQALLQVIARAYGKRDAAAALEWAQSQTGQRGIVAAVIAGVAEQDPHRALDLAFALTSPGERMQAVQLAAGYAARTDADAEAIANRLLAADNPAVRESLAFGVVTSWASRSPDSAMRWLLRSGQNASPNVYQQLGQVLAMRDPRNAIGYSAQIPTAALEPWVNGVAQGYAQNDPQGAVDWLRQYRGESWYDRAAGTAAMYLAQRDGAAAARLLDELDVERMGAMQARQVANMVAANWANSDPAAAAAWAADRRDQGERDMTMRSVVGLWSSQDFAGARQWALRLPQGATRDSALSMLLTTSAYNTNAGLDPAILNGFASDSARNSAVMQVVQGMAYNDPARARRLVDLHVTDPSARAQAERMIEAAGNNGGPRPAMGIAGGVRGIPPSIVIQR